MRLDGSALPLDAGQRLFPKERKPIDDVVLAVGWAPGKGLVSGVQIELAPCLKRVASLRTHNPMNWAFRGHSAIRQIDMEEKIEKIEVAVKRLGRW